jgi:hypothetical protein
MEIISQRAVLFKRLVVDDLKKTYDLKNLNSLKRICKLQPDKMYSRYNYMILHNSIINDRYKKTLDPSKYSIVFVLYKNIVYNEKNGVNVARLDLSTKQDMKRVLQRYEKYDCISSNIQIIGRKYIYYKDNNIRNDNCFGMICTYDVNKVSAYDADKRTSSSETSDVKIPTNYSKSVLRRRFLNNVRETIMKQLGYDTPNTSLVIRNGIFLDVEFTNDIYDNFDTFPISSDTSMLFMIGLSFVKRDVVEYINFTTEMLTKTCEFNIMNSFLETLEQKYEQTGISPVIFHWSNADKYIIEKTLARYPELKDRYNDLLDKIVYIDLLVVVKKTLTDLESYSLKYVSKHLLNVKYDTECKNGLDAMCSVIKNNIELENNGKGSLLCFENTQDVINYNKLDTTLLYHITKYFIL